MISGTGASRPAEAGAVWLLALGQTLIYAGVYYGFPSLLPALLAETGWSSGMLAAGPTLGFLVMAALVPFAGRLVDRGFGGELLVYLPVLAAAGLVGLGFARSPLEWLCLWAVIGAAQAGCFYETCFAFLTRRLGERARSAITKVTLVAGFAGTLAFPLGGWLGRSFGAQEALIAFAGLILLIAVPANVLAVRALRRGERLGGPVERSGAGVLRAALRRKVFWAMALMFGLVMLQHSLLLTYVLVLFEDRGASVSAATFAAAAIGPAQVLGRLVLLMQAARIGNARAMLGSLVMMLVASVLLWLAGFAPGLILAFALLQGAGIGLVSILRPALVADILGRQGFGAISGAVAMAPTLAAAGAPLLGAQLLHMGGPGAVVTVCFLLSCAATLLGVWVLTGRAAA